MILLREDGRFEMRGGMVGEVVFLVWFLFLCIFFVCFFVCCFFVGLVVWWVYELYLKYFWGVEVLVGYMYIILYFLLLLFLLLLCLFWSFLFCCCCFVEYFREVWVCECVWMWWMCYNNGLDLEVELCMMVCNCR